MRPVSSMALTKNSDGPKGPATRPKSKTVRQIIKANIGGHVEVIMTDESQIYPWALNKIQKKKHQTICHSKEYAAGDVCSAPH
jgi:hypothetical protein